MKKCRKPIQELWLRGPPEFGQEARHMLVYLALLMPVLLLFCGLVVDVGQMEVRRLQMQSASDAGALGAAQELERGVASYVTYGQSEASSNGFTNGSANTTVAVAQQPTYGAYSGFYDAVQTTITQQVPLTFLSLLGSKYSTVSTQSTALVAPCAYLSGAAGLAAPVLSVTSSSVGTVMSSTCPWYINKSASVDSNSSFSALAENVTGSASASSWTVGSGSSPRYNVATQSDPLASITQPTAGTCSSTKSITASASLAPGTYCGLNVKCSSTCLITLQPGMYIFEGGLTAVNAVFNGTGYTFYFTRSGNNYGTVNFSVTNGTSTTWNYCLLEGSAPSDASNGGIPGVLVMNDRNWVHTNAQDFTFTGAYNAASGIYATGSLYLTGTGASFSYSYLYAPSGYLAIDVDNLVVSNGSLVGLKSDFSEVSGGSPFLPQGGLVQ